MQKPLEPPPSDLEPNHDMGVLARLGLWGAAAAASLLIVAIVARTEAGQRRFTLLSQGVFQGGGAMPAAVAGDERRGVVRNAGSENRKLAEEVRSLAQDRERLIARMAMLERNYEDVTGSTGKAAKPRAAEAAAPADPEFAVDLGGASSLSALRAAWDRVKGKHADALEGLRPVVGVREGPGGGVELRLVVGPLDDPTRAAKLCATFAAAGLSCEPAIFDGQRLALR